MARIRSLKPEFFRSRSLAKVPKDARLTFAGLWCEADDAGNGVADPRILAGAIWPLDDDVGWEAVQGHLRDLAGVGAIQMYDVDGESYYAIPKWEKHQSAAFRRGEPKYPPRPSANPIVQPARGDVQNADVENEGLQSARGGVLEGSKEQGGEQGAGSRESDAPDGAAKSKREPEGFAEFYAKYPLHKGRAAAAKAYAKAVKIASRAEILAGCVSYAERSEHPSFDKRFIPYPQKWLNDGHWEDEPDPEPSAAVVASRNGHSRGNTFEELNEAGREFLEARR